MSRLSSIQSVSISKDDRLVTPFLKYYCNKSSKLSIKHTEEINASATDNHFQSTVMDSATEPSTQTFQAQNQTKQGQRLGAFSTQKRLPNQRELTLRFLPVSDNDPTCRSHRAILLEFRFLQHPAFSLVRIAGSAPTGPVKWSELNLHSRTQITNTLTTALLNQETNHFTNGYLQLTTARQNNPNRTDVRQSPESEWLRAKRS